MGKSTGGEIVMKQKRVSFKVAKAIKEAGYPQGEENTARYNENGLLVKPFVFNGGNEIADAPTYLDVWIWLWREKNIRINTRDYFGGLAVSESSSSYDSISHTDPEEAIAATIEYLVDNDLIK